MIVSRSHNFCLQSLPANAVNHSAPFSIAEPSLPVRSKCWDKIYNFALRYLFLPALRIPKENAANAKNNFTNYMKARIRFEYFLLPLEEVLKSNNPIQRADAYLNEDYILLMVHVIKTELIGKYSHMFHSALTKDLSDDNIPLQNNWLEISAILKDNNVDVSEFLKRHLKPFFIPPKDVMEGIEHSLLQKKIEDVRIPATNGANLDGMAIYSTAKGLESPQEQKWLVFFDGNESVYEYHLTELQPVGERIRANVLAINYRGVGFSTGKPRNSNDLIEDGRAAVRYLLNQGVQPKNIICWGFSQGGGVAAAVAAEYQNPGQEMMLALDRTFSTYKKAATLLVRKTVCCGLACIVNYILTRLQWGFDVLADYLKVKGFKIILEHKSDGMVQQDARIGYTVRKMWKSKAQDIPKPIIVYLENFDSPGKCPCLTKGSRAHCAPLVQKLWINQADMYAGTNKFLNKIRNHLVAH